jgi:hypothetical protein
MAAKKPAVVEKVKKAKPQLKVKIPKHVSASPDKVWRKLMITAIREAAHHAKYSNVGKEAKPAKGTQEPEAE